jgi:hypothetical protein
MLPISIFFFISSPLISLKHFIFSLFIIFELNTKTSKEKKRKKILLSVIAAFFAAGNVFAIGELNLKGSIDVGGTISGDYTYSYSDNRGNKGSETEDISGGGSGISIAAEYLFPISGQFKAGPGLGYLTSRKTNLTIDGNDLIDFKYNTLNPSISYLPIYITAQVNPIAARPEIFFKGNIGYSFFYLDLGESVENAFTPDDSENPENIAYINTTETLNGGLYIELATGYEFPFGLILELSWASIKSSAEYLTTLTVRDLQYRATEKRVYDFTYSKIGFTSVYKFKL